MNTKILLSICIPTYNRSQYLESALSKLLREYDDNFELVIVDGGSKDDTLNIVEKYKNKFKYFTSFTREENVGIDKDVLKMVELAKGKFCWLLSDDDEIVPGCIDVLINKIQSFNGGNCPSGFSVNISAYSSNMEFEVSSVPSVGRGRAHDDIIFHSSEEAFRNLGVHFGFLSAQIINREIWNRSIEGLNLEKYFNAWLLVFIIGKMLEINPYWIYLHRKCIRYRTGNDSFIQRMGVVERQKLAHYELPRIIMDLFDKKSNVYRSVLNIMLHDRMARSLAVLKASNITIREQFSLLKMYYDVYKSFPIFWIKIVPIFFVPSFVFHFTKELYMHYKSNNIVKPINS